MISFSLLSADDDDDGTFSSVLSSVAMTGDSTTSIVVLLLLAALALVVVRPELLVIADDWGTIGNDIWKYYYGKSKAMRPKMTGNGPLLAWIFAALLVASAVDAMSMR